MRRRAKPAKVKAGAKRPLARKAPKNGGARVHDLEERLAEALEQQSATREILRVISSSPTELQPVLDAVAESAARLCAAYDAIIFRLDGEVLRRVAHSGPIPAPAGFVIPATRSRVTGRAVLSREPIQVADAQAKSEEFPETKSFAREHGFRTILSVPLMREGIAIGTIDLRRREVRQFSDRQIALLQTFADQAVIAIENVRLFNETKEALERQTAISEILRVIGSSPTDVQPVFETIARSGVIVCAALGCAVFIVDGDMLRVAATHGVRPERLERFRQEYPAPLDAKIDTALTIRERRIFHLADIEHNPDATASDIENARLAGYRTRLMVPMVRGNSALGLIAVTREAPTPFPDQQVALLKTFADQAVIAIENVRLVTELQASNLQLTTALEQQTASGEILRVVSSSPTDEKAVFDAIARSSIRLCGAAFSVVAILDADEMLHLVASDHVGTEGRQSLAAAYPMRPNRGQLAGRAILDRAVVHVPDVALDPEYVGAALGNRATLSVPMLRQGMPIGTITIGRFEPLPFSDQQIQLLQTFADQAVIAIENVRLFNETKEALERQTATSEILRVISSSPTDVQPVFDAIVRSAARLCDGVFCNLFRFDGELIHLVAAHNLSHEALGVARQIFPAPLTRELTAGRAILDRATIHIPDIENDPELDPSFARRMGAGSALTVPLFRDGQPIGTINVGRAEPGPFSPKQIELMQTFADQAVIAIENVRLFTELQERNRDVTESLEQQTATSDILRAISEAQTDAQTVFDAIARSTVRLCEAARSTVWRPEGDLFRSVARCEMTPEGHVVSAPRGEALDADSLPSRAIRERQIVRVNDVPENPTVPPKYRERARVRGYRSLMAVPMVREGLVVGAITVVRSASVEFSDQQVGLVKTFADQAVIAIENVRLLTELQARNRDIEDKSRQLEAASQHKSEFLANMSHELRTPLNAIIGFSEVLTERMFGELNEKQEEYLKDISASGTHLLSLINDILDLSKIEAGRMELELTDFDLPTALDSALTLVRERAGRRGISLESTIDERLGELRADERKIRQVVLNLLSNAIKFTPEGGRIEVRAAPVDGSVEVSVSDTGVGIAPEDQEAVFEEFRQVGTSAAKQEGTGLGLALCRKFVELHGGRIWVTSQVGVGATFTFTIPVRRHE